MYIMRIKGSGKIPDYIQLRNDDFTLKGYFREDRLEQGLEKSNMSSYYSMIRDILKELKFGEIKFIKKGDH